MSENKINRDRTLEEMTQVVEVQFETALADLRKIHDRIIEILRPCLEVMDQLLEEVRKC